MVGHCIRIYQIRWHRPFSADEDFDRFSSYMGMPAIFHVTSTIWTSFRPPIQYRLHMKFCFDKPSCFRGDVCKILADVTWAATWQNQQTECAPSEDSDQPGHPPSLIRVFVVSTEKALVLSFPLSAQRRLWSDWTDNHIAGFVMSWLTCVGLSMSVWLRWA